MPYLIALGVVIFLIIWLVAAQRNLVETDERCKNALSQIGVQQNSRWDALTALAQLTKSYNEHEYKTLMDVISKRQQIDSSSSATSVDQQEDLIKSTLSKIVAIAEAYPDLKAQQSYSKTMSSVNEYENNVRMSRMVYNDTVTRFNQLVRQIPTSIAASIFKFRDREYLKTEDSKTQMPDMTI